MEGRGGDAAGIRAPGGPAPLDDLGPHQQRRDRSVRRPRLRRGQRRRRRARRGDRAPDPVPLLPVQERHALGRFRRPPRRTCAICSPTWIPACRSSDALRTALLAFNTFDDTETARHRQRMRVILETAELQAYSMTMYAGWRAVVAAFVARRLGTKAGDLVPQTVAWTMLGVALSAYEHWLADESVSLAERAGRRVRHRQRGLGALDLKPRRKKFRLGRRSSGFAATIRV